jgi:hypothetical protein
MDLTVSQFHFRFTSENGLRLDIAPCPKSQQQTWSVSPSVAADHAKRPLRTPPQLPVKVERHQRREALPRREAGDVPTDIARTNNVSH